MQEFLGQYYLYIKALHVISVMAWMAGLLYLPRLYVYHAQEDKGSKTSETLKVMERKLLKYIMNPASIAAWTFGGLMLWANTGLFEQGWMHAKLTCIVLMTGVHHIYAAWQKKFARDENTKSHSFYRYWNEVPTVLMIVIVIMAVAKPF